MWPSLLHLLQIGNPSVVRRLRADGTPEFDDRVSGVINLVCRRTSSRTSLGKRSIDLNHAAGLMILFDPPYIGYVLGHADVC